MPDLGLALPAGTRLVSLAERPDLEDALDDHTGVYHDPNVWAVHALR